MSKTDTATVVAPTDIVEPKDQDKTESGKKEKIMHQLMLQSTATPKIGDVVEGPVIIIDKNSVYVDLFPYGTGIIYGREFVTARDLIKKIPVGDRISAKVVDFHEKDGYYELSLREAKQAIIWGEALEVLKEKRPIEVTISEANKGGLIIVWQGIQGFLPASQLKSEHYPRVADGDKDKILDELKKLVGEKLIVTVITAVPNEAKLIFSEKIGGDKEKEKIVEKYKVSDVVDGEVTGIVDFGVFVKIENGLEGLVHISELDWSLVEDPRTMFKVGQKVKVKVIDVKEGKVSLSIKALKPNPWVEAAKKYKKDSTVEGLIIKFNKYGALASIEEGVAGLVHVSEFGNEQTLRQHLDLGKSYKFKIVTFDAKSQKMTLSYTQANPGVIKTA